MTEPHTHSTANPSEARPAHPLIPAERVNGTTVYNREGDKLGSVEDIAVDKLSGQVAYAILGFGGVLGLGERYYPVPWSLLTYDTERKGYVIPCDKGKLHDAPSFQADDLSGWDDSDVRQGIYDYYGPYGARPYWMGLA